MGERNSNLQQGRDRHQPRCWMQKRNSIFIKKLATELKNPITKLPTYKIHFWPTTNWKKIPSLKPWSKRKAEKTLPSANSDTARNVMMLSHRGPTIVAFVMNVSWEWIIIVLGLEIVLGLKHINILYVICFGPYWLHFMLVYLHNT